MPQRAEGQRARVMHPLQAAVEAHHAISDQSRRLTQGKRLSQGKIVHPYDSTIAPIRKGKSNWPAQCGRTPGLSAEPTAGFVLAMHLPVGNPSDAIYVVPLVDKVQGTLARVTRCATLTIHAVASDLGATDPTVRQALHARGILTVGMPRTVAPMAPSPTQAEVLQSLHHAGLTQRTPHQGHLAYACGSSRPVVESHIASGRARGAGQVRYKGPQGAARQLGMTVMASHGAALVRIRQQRLSKRAPKFRRLLGLRYPKVNQCNASKN